jgi:hypothetical protein
MPACQISFAFFGAAAKKKAATLPMSRGKANV